MRVSFQDAPNKSLQQTSFPVTPFAFAKAAPGKAAAELGR